MSFWAFIVPYYEGRLRHYEGLDLGRCAERELLAAAREASALRKFLADLVEEGYTDTAELLRQRTGAAGRLQRFVGAALEVLGPPPERERFYLIPEPVGVPIPPVEEAFAGAPEICLHDYLDRLKVPANDPVDISGCFDDPRQMRRWQHKTAQVMTEMVGFLGWIDGRLRACPRMVPVPLLRDALLIHLGLTWLGREPLPVFISRSFANTWNTAHPIHETLADVVYRVLLEQGSCSLETMRRHFAALLQGDAGGVPASFMQACREQLASLDAGGPPAFIESGVQGTFVLQLLTLSGPAAGMLLYTTVPWLYDTYAASVYQPNYNYLREMETIVAHDHLFRFSAWRNGRVYVTESTDDRIRRLAAYEISLFGRLVAEM